MGEGRRVGEGLGGEGGGLEERLGEGGGIEEGLGEGGGEGGGLGGRLGEGGGMGREGLAFKGTVKGTGVGDFRANLKY